MLDMNRIIAFVLTSLAIYLINKVIKFGFKILLILIGVAAVLYFVMPEIIPQVVDWGKNIVA